MSVVNQKMNSEPSDLCLFLAVFESAHFWRTRRTRAHLPCAPLAHFWRTGSVRRVRQRRIFGARLAHTRIWRTRLAHTRTRRTRLSFGAFGARKSPPCPWAIADFLRAELVIDQVLLPGPSLDHPSTIPRPSLDHPGVPRRPLPPALPWHRFPIHPGRNGRECMGMYGNVWGCVEGQSDPWCDNQANGNVAATHTLIAMNRWWMVRWRRRRGLFLVAVSASDAICQGLQIISFIIPPSCMHPVKTWSI